MVVVQFACSIAQNQMPNLDFRGFSGTIASGTIRPGDTIKVLPSAKTSKVKDIVTYDGNLDLAVAGEAVTLTLEDEIDISRGDVIAGHLPGYDAAQSITICDLTGTGVQDTAIATLARERAQAAGLGTSFRS